MNPIVALVALVAIADVAQRPAQLAGWSPRQRAVAAGGLIGAVVAIAAIASPLLRALDVAGPTMQVGAAMVVALWAIWQLFTWSAEPAPAPLAGGLVPGLFPLLLTPPFGVASLAVAARNGFPVPVVAAVIVAAAVALTPAAVGRRPLRRLTATAALVAAVALMVDGVYAI